MNYIIIDAHAHIYPEQIADKATKSISDFYGIQMTTNHGSTDILLSNGALINVSKYIISSVSTTTHQVRSINKFLIGEAEKHKEFIPLITLHPDLSREEIKNEIKFGLDNGAKGIKLHPDFQKFYIDDTNVYKIYEEAQNIFPILFHTGDTRYDFSRPIRLTKVAKEFPNLICIAAHLGGFSRWDEVECYRGLDNVYFDTSSSLSFITPSRATEIIKMKGIDKVLWGCDFPMWNHKEEYDKFMKLPLSEEERTKIFSLNAEKLFKI
jgi:predicted TIM-barrel fold metal-dependent hydrolase